MAEIKLGPLPDRTPVKLTIMLAPELHDALMDYARVYAQTYAHEEPVGELVPAMLKTFLESDRVFAKRRRSVSGCNNVIK